MSHASQLTLLRMICHLDGADTRLTSYYLSDPSDPYNQHLGYLLISLGENQPAFTLSSWILTPSNSVH